MGTERSLCYIDSKATRLFCLAYSKTAMRLGVQREVHIRRSRRRSAISAASHTPLLTHWTLVCPLASDPSRPHRCRTVRCITSPTVVGLPAMQLLGRRGFTLWLAVVRLNLNPNPVTNSSWPNSTFKCNLRPYHYSLFLAVISISFLESKTITQFLPTPP